MNIRKEIRTIIMIECHSDVSLVVAKKPFYTTYGGVRMRADVLMRRSHQEIADELVDGF